jgi:SAM-dependent methyltransferase
MSAPSPDFGTDQEWEEWGRRDPYFAVQTDPRFRLTSITQEAKRYFFETGQWEVGQLMRIIRQHIDPDFSPRTVLDFGCGVGRSLIPFSDLAREVVGLDVSPSMLREARRNCDERKASNVKLLLCDDALSSLTGTFDLIHSYITFQHIPPDRGRAIFCHLLDYLAPGSVAALHVTYAKMHFAASHGVAPPSPPPTQPALARPSSSDPEMQMNSYMLNELFFLMQSRGVKRFHTEFTDHSGELGVFLLFQAT